MRLRASRGPKLDERARLERGVWLRVLDLGPHRRAAGEGHGGVRDLPGAVPDTEDVTEETYGPLKAACEQVVTDAFGDRGAVIRPGYIVGPNDPTDRFTSWVRRAARGGEMLAPGPADGAIQFVDARDLGAFMLHLAETATGGIYNVTHPRGR